MIHLNVMGGKIVGSYGETPFSIKYTKDKYEELVAIADKANNAETVEDYQLELEKFGIRLTDNTEALEEYMSDLGVYYNQKTGQYFLKVKDIISKIPMPDALVHRLAESLDKGISCEPLIKFWTRWLRNPILHKKSATGNMGRAFSERMFDFMNMEYVHPKLVQQFLDQGYSDEIAQERARMYQVKITQEGLINGYKVSREVLHAYNSETGEVVDRYKRTFNINTGEIESEGLPEHVEDRLFEPAIMGSGGDAFYCESLAGDSTLGHHIKVGHIHRLPDWGMVNTDDSVSCVPGLHVGGLNYINCYSGEIHNIFIDPMYVGAVPDSVDGAIRCKEYFVHSSLAGVNGSIYHSSKYAAKTDEAWEIEREEAIKISNEIIKSIEDTNDLLKAL